MLWRRSLSRADNGRSSWSKTCAHREKSSAKQGEDSGEPSMPRKSGRNSRSRRYRLRRLPFSRKTGCGGHNSSTCEPSRLRTAACSRFCRHFPRSELSRKGKLLDTPRISTIFVHEDGFSRKKAAGEVTWGFACGLAERGESPSRPCPAPWPRCSCRFPSSATAEGKRPRSRVICLHDLPLSRPLWMAARSALSSLRQRFCCFFPCISFSFLSRGPSERNSRAQPHAFG